MSMSFSGAVKEDLARIKPSLGCCRLAELIAFLRAAGSFSLNDSGAKTLTLCGEYPQIMRLIFVLLKDVFAVKAYISFHKKNNLRKNNVYTIHIPPQEKIAEIWALADLPPSKRLDENDGAETEGLNAGILARPCCRRSYLRGAFLGGGSINNPRGDYHLEISFNDKQNAFLIKDLLAGFAVKTRITQRKRHFIVYMKGAEFIAETLIILGSHRSLLDFENVRIEKDIRNHVNRQINCENANLNRTVLSSEGQIMAIRKIAKNIGISRLPEALRLAAISRLRNPEGSLNDLAQELGIGRSGVNHRLRRIKKIADELGE
jgi:DNA-binding protein WhiA